MSFFHCYKQNNPSQKLITQEWAKDCLTVEKIKESEKAKQKHKKTSSEVFLKFTEIFL